MTPLNGKVAIVTGTSAPQGIGRAIALRLAAEGASLVVADIGGSVALHDQVYDRAVLQAQLVADIEQAGGRARAMQVDVTQQSDIERCVADTIGKFGGLDILVNNAGSLAGSDEFLSTTPEQWEASFRVNLLGPMMFCQAVIPPMRERGGGRIINIGSTGSLGAEAGFGAYTTMKHGMVGLSKTLAAEFGADGILCNTVCPGYIMTDMHAAANKRLAAQWGVSIEQAQQRRYAGVALRNAGRPQDVAAAVAYLAGPNADYVTGINLPVTGGVPCGI